MNLNKKSALQLLKNNIMWVIGCSLYSIGVCCFAVPNSIAQSGFTGIAVIVNHLFSLPVGIVNLALNIPMLILMWIFLGRQLVARTLWVTVILSAALDVFGAIMPTYTGDTLLASLFCGILEGAGLGLIFLRGATTGGSEVAARLLERRFSGVPVGQLILLVDGVVIAIAALVYRDLESALYAALMIYVTTEVLDALVYGRRRGKMMLIMSGEPDRIAKEILTQMGRGVTILKATGAYTGDDRRVLLCAVSRSEVYALRTLVTAIDPAAFVILTSADEVHGQGFTKE